MKSHPALRRACVVLLAVLATLSASAAQAQLFRAYLSFNGSDGNDCTVAHPCRLLPAALAAVRDGGEVWMVDSANYNTGPVTIGKGVKILAIPGAMGSILANGGDALIVNAPGKDVTLRNLVVLNFASGMNGINIQDAAAVHIEKTTVHDFDNPSGACVLLSTSSTVRLFIDDSFLRHCRAGLHASVPIALGNRPSVALDNVRIERGSATSGLSIGIWQQGCLDVSIRNSMIGRQDTAIGVDSLIGSCTTHLDVVNSQLLRNTTAISIANATPNVTVKAAVIGSQIQQSSDAIAVSNTGSAGDFKVMISGTDIASSNNAITVANNVADATSQVRVDVVQSQIHEADTAAIDVNASSGSKSYVDIRESTLAHSTRAIKTTGTAGSVLRVSVVRSNVHHATYGIDHHYGVVRLDGSHFVSLTNSFVNSGSGSISSLGNNFLSDNTDSTGGLVYITPSIVPGI
jgi:hypothetical protein